MDEAFLKILNLLAPGKDLREGIERIMDAGLGGLIFLASDDEKYIKEGLIQLGFKIDCDFSPEKIYELGKMDGAIVLNESGDKILYANVQINPEKTIFTNETGMRHRTAEKTSYQTDDIVIAVSKRRNTVSVFYKKKKYDLLPESILFARLNQEITIAQRYKQNFLDLMSFLNIEETRGTVNLYDVAEIISKGMLTIRITEGIDRYLKELGKIAGSVKLEYEEILKSIPRYVGSIIMDYHIDELNFQKPEEAIQIFKDVKTEEFTNFNKVLKTIGHEISTDDSLAEIQIVPRGYRILTSTKIPVNSIRNVVDTFKNLNKLFEVSFEDLTEVPGIGKKRADIILSILTRKKKGLEVEI
jgi:diadenylate cyclase